MTRATAARAGAGVGSRALAKRYPPLALPAAAAPSVAVRGLRRDSTAPGRSCRAVCGLSVCVRARRDEPGFRRAGPRRRRSASAASEPVAPSAGPGVVPKRSGIGVSPEMNGLGDWWASDIALCPYTRTRPRFGPPESSEPATEPALTRHGTLSRRTASPLPDGVALSHLEMALLRGFGAGEGAARLAQLVLGTRVVARHPAGLPPGRDEPASKPLRLHFAVAQCTLASHHLPLGRSIRRCASAGTSGPRLALAAPPSAAATSASVASTARAAASRGRSRNARIRRAVPSPRARAASALCGWCARARRAFAALARGLLHPLELGQAAVGDELRVADTNVCEP